MISLTDTRHILLTGYGDEETNQIEILANGTTSICQPSKFKFPRNIDGASGVLVGTSMIVCGDDENADVCYIFEDQDKNWRLLARMKENAKARTDRELSEETKELRDALELDS